MELASTFQRGLRGVSAALSHLVHWRRFFDTYNPSSTADRIRLLAHSGHGSVSFLLSDIPRVTDCAPKVVRMTLRRIIGLPILGTGQL